MTLRKRVFYFQLPPEALRDIDSFIERLLSRLPANVSRISLDRGRLRVEVYAPASRIKDLSLTIRRVLSEFSGVTTVGHGRTRIPLSRFMSGEGPAVPLDILCLVTEKKALCDCEASDGHIETDCDYETITEVLASIKRALDELSRIPHLSRGARKAITSLMVIEDVHAFDVLRFMEDNGFIVWEGNRFVLTRPWKETVYNALKRGLLKGGAQE